MAARAGWALAILPPGGALVGAVYGIVLTADLWPDKDSGGVVMFAAIVGLIVGGFTGALGATFGALTYLVRTRHRTLATMVGAVLGVGVGWCLLLVDWKGQWQPPDLTAIIPAIGSLVATALCVGVLPRWHGRAIRDAARKPR